MKKSVFFAAVFFILFSLINLRAQNIIQNHSITGICYAGSKINRIYVPPPKDFTRRLASKSGGPITLVYSGVPEEGKIAVNYAIKIIESMLPSDIKLTIKASWRNFSGPMKVMFLGVGRVTGYVEGWEIDAFNPIAFYPVTVAEKIAGRSLDNDSVPDIEIAINSKIPWYFKTDGNTPSAKYDLVTVVLHEVCHGLGFDGSFYIDSSKGNYGDTASIPEIYDTFVENLSGEKLTDTAFFKHNSLNLGQELVGGQLYFNGPLTRRYLNEGRARLYSPPAWDQGSSVVHLDESSTAEINSLMTPYIDLGEAIHDPGNLTFSILGDLGWINTKILTQKIKDTEDHLIWIDISATIKSDTSYSGNLVGIVYSFDDFRTFDTLMMTSALSDNNYSAKVFIPSYNAKLSYYIFAADNFSRIYKSPSFPVKPPFTVFIGTDTVRPVISHTPLRYCFENIDSIPFEADVTDNVGIDAVYLEYKINNGPLKYFGLIAGDQDKYNAKINAKQDLVTGGDTLKYRIIAVDKSVAGNTCSSPSKGYYSIRIEPVRPVRKYVTDFSDASNDFFMLGFRISRPQNFSSYGLNTDHPYRSPDQNNKSMDLTSVLRRPLIFNDSGMVFIYRELVLVDPGYEDVLFGYYNSADYAIVEGSKDFGKNWFSLADGYNSRINTSWEASYNSAFDSHNNSTFIGKESMMMTHYLFPQVNSKISDGDTLLIRFRLHSDLNFSGWGWVIDDLKINPENSGELIANDLRVFPNPGNGLINIDIGNGNKVNSVEINIYDALGKNIIKRQFYPAEPGIVNISGNPPGVYIIVIKGEYWTKNIKYVLIK